MNFSGLFLHYDKLSFENKQQKLKLSKTQIQNYETFKFELDIGLQLKGKQFKKAFINGITKLELQQSIKKTSD